MSGPLVARDGVAVVGYAHSPIERHADRPLGIITLEAARAAIADAGLTVDQIDGFVSSSLFPTAGDHKVVDGVSTVTSGWLAERLGVVPAHVSGFQGFGQIPGTVTLAVNAIASGAADYVLLHRALHNPRSGGYHRSRMRTARGSQQWVAPQGLFGPMATIGLTANEYLQRYGAGRDALAAVVVEARKNGSRIPWSYWHEQPLSEQEYFDAPMISDPICRLDCDLPVDGSVVFVLTSTERARDLPHRPVLVSGVAGSMPTRRRLPMHWPLDDMMEAGTALADRLWRSAGVGPAEVDLPQVYDGFSPFVLFWLEVLGFCPVGEAHRMVLDGGIDSDRPGALPALSGGGAIGNGRMHGVPQMLECYLQLSGRAGERQRRAEVGVACHSSPHLGGAIVYRAGDR